MRPLAALLTLPLHAPALTADSPGQGVGRYPVPGADGPLGHGKPPEKSMAALSLGAIAAGARDGEERRRRAAALPPRPTIPKR
jgi:hypothetical protein